jgi:hypothetical protein
MVVAVKKKNGLKLIGKQVMRICMAGNIVALQTAPSQVTVMDIVKKAKQQSGSSLEIRLDHYVKDIFVSHNFIMLRLSDGTLAIYNITEGSPLLLVSHLL